jgi:hypothetical protein
MIPGHSYAGGQGSGHEQVEMSLVGYIETSISPTLSPLIDDRLSRSRADCSSGTAKAKMNTAYQLSNVTRQSTMVADRIHPTTDMSPIQPVRFLLRRIKLRDAMK